MRIVVSAICCLLTSAETYAAVVLSEGGTIATVDVAAGSETTLTADDVAAITGTGVTEFRKTGAGVLCSDETNASLARLPVRSACREAFYKIDSAGALGTVAGATYVETHATLQVATSAAVNFGSEKFFIAGEGVEVNGNSYGALYLSTTQTVTLKYITLTGDAAVWHNGMRSTTTTRALPGTTRDIEPRGGFKNVGGSATVTPGHIVYDKDGRCLNSGINFGWTYQGGATNTLTAGGYMNAWPTPSKTPWTWIVTNALNIRVNTGTDTAFPTSMITSVSDYMWGGPVVLSADVAMGNADATDGRWQIAGFKGPISGAGNIAMANSSKPLETWFKLGSANPDWTGAISVKRDYAVVTNASLALYPRHTGLALLADGALTQDKLELKNAELYLGGTASVIRLPEIETEGYGCIWGTATGVVGTVTKTGGGTLMIQSKLHVTNTLDIASGTLKLGEMPDINFYQMYGVAGLTEGWWWEGTNETGAFNTTWTTASRAEPTFDEVMSTHRRVRPTGAPAAWYDGNNSCSLSAAAGGAQPQDGGAWWWGSSAPGRGNYQRYAYQGYIWNRSGANAVWGFNSCFNMRCDVWVDGTLATSGKYFSSYAEVTNGYHEIEMTPGPHEIKIMLYPAQGCSAGAAIKVNNVEVGRWWSKAKALAYDPDGANTLYNEAATTNLAYQNLITKDFKALYDTGDGSLLTTTNKTQEEFAQEFDWSPYYPVFSNLVFAANTVFDLNGMPNFMQTNLGGFPLVTNGILTVTKMWTVNGTAVAGGAKMEVRDASFALADGALIRLTDASAMCGQNVEFPLAVSDHPISLGAKVALDTGADKRSWRLVLSPDKRTLSVSYTSGLVILIN
jgi:hypothetical protein